MKLKLPLCIAGLIMLFASAAHAVDSLQVTAAWIPEAPPVASVMAGYLAIHNPGAQDVTITAVRSADFASVEMHETRMQDGMARMIKQDRLVIPAGSSVMFERGGLHLMLMQPKRSFRAGDSIAIELVTSNGNVKFVASVRAASLDEHEHHHHHH